MKAPDLFQRLRHGAAQAWIIAEKDIRIYYAKPPVIMFGIALPFFMFWSWSVGRHQPAESLIPGLVTITLFFAASSIGPVVIPWEKRVHTFERLLVAPVALTTILLGKTLAGVVFGVVVAALPLLFGLVLGTEVTNGVFLLVAFLLSAGAFASLGVLFSNIPGQNVGSVMMPATLIRWPLLFVSGLFIPLDDLVWWARIVAYFSPLTYANDIIFQAMGGAGHFHPLSDFSALTVFWVVFIEAGLWLHNQGLK
jgi:ABC-2 type transport system permease protein